MNSNRDALNTLAWLVDAGADEAVGTEPINRLRRPEPEPKSAAPAPAAPAVPAPAAGGRTARPRAARHTAGAGAGMMAVAAETLDELRDALAAFDGSSPSSRMAAMISFSISSVNTRFLSKAPTLLHSSV